MHTDYKKVEINSDELVELKAIEHDLKSRFVEFQFLSNNVPVNLSKCTVRVYALNSKRSEIFNNLKVIDALRGKAKLELTDSFLKFGRTRYQLKIYGANGEKLSSNIFSLSVGEDLMSDNAIEGSNEFKALDVALNQVDSIDVKLKEVDNKLDLKAKGIAKTFSLPIANTYYKVAKLTSWSQNSALITIVAKGDNSQFNISRLIMSTNLGYDPKLSVLQTSVANKGAISFAKILPNVSGDGSLQLYTNTSNVEVTIYIDSFDGINFVEPIQTSDEELTSIKVNLQQTAKVYVDKLTDGFKINIDGTVEQWGYTSLAQGDTWFTVALPISYKDNNYNIQVTPYYTDRYVPIYCGVVEKDKFKVAYVGSDSNGARCYWRTIGFV